MSTSTNTTIKTPDFKFALPDPQPLRDSIAAVRVAPNKLEKLGAEKTSLEKEIADYIANEDGGDPARLQQIAGYRIRLEMLPNVEARMKSEIAATGEALFPVLDAFIDDLLSSAKAEYEAWMDVIEAHLKPYAPNLPARNGGEINHARNVAIRLPMRTTFPNLINVLEHLAKPTATDRENTLASRNHDTHDATKADWVRHAVNRAARALLIHDELKRAGRFWYRPDEIPALDKAAMEKADEEERRSTAERHAAETKAAEERERLQNEMLRKLERETEERLTPAHRYGP